ncbi:MAG: RNA polymerase sigma factor, partial [Acidimicrobiia bacterium]
NIYMSAARGMRMATETLIESFTLFVKDTEPGLKHALVAAFGREIGLEATAEALAHGWEHWERIQAMDNPGGYLWGVGRNKARASQRRQVKFPALPEARDEARWIEPGLPAALARLSERQRLAVLLIHGYRWTHKEVAEWSGTSVPTVQKHLERGMAKLRRTMRTEK